MTTINVSNLIIQLQEKLNSADEKDLLYYSKAIQQLKSGKIFVVNTLSNLPNFQQNTYYLYYVLSDRSLYLATTDGWINVINSSVGVIYTWGSDFNNTVVTSVSPIRESSSSINWCQISAGGVFHAIKKDGSLWSNGIIPQTGTGISGTFTSPIREFCSATDWCRVNAGNLHSAAIKTSGELWSWGNGQYGALGNGTTVNSCSPIREISSSTDWCQVSAGAFTSSAIKTTGQLWTWGRNNCGQLGDGTVTLRCSPVRERCSATDWCQVSTGYRHNSALKTSGELWTWGLGQGGGLGDGTTINRCSPVREITSSANWCQISASNSATAAIKTTGELWVWGLNSCGRIGDGTIVSKCSPVREFCSATDWCQVSFNDVSTACFFLSAAVKTSGQIWTWGNNYCGGLGNGAVGTGSFSCSPIREISSASNWSCVSTGNSWAAGLKSFSL